MQCQRDQFSIPPGTHYLNCAYMSPLSKRVVAAGTEALKRKCVPSDITPRDFFDEVDRIRGLFARLINVSDPNLIAMIPAVSYGIATVAKNAPLSRGQNMLTVQHQFPSNVYTWRRLCAERHAELRVVQPPDRDHERGAAWNQRILEAIDRQTALVALPNVHWTDGTIFDLIAIGARAREVGALLVIDGTQSVGAMQFDTAAIQPDAVVCAGYKWLMGPYSTGAAYFGPRLLDGVPLEETWIARLGSEDFSGLVEYEDRYRPGAIPYDVGENSNFALTPMLRTSLEQVLEWGVENVTAYIGNLTRELFPCVREKGYRVESDDFRAQHLFGIRVPSGSDTQKLRAKLEARSVFVSVRGDAIRISPHVYNDAGDVARLMDAL